MIWKHYIWHLAYEIDEFSEMSSEMSNWYDVYSWCTLEMIDALNLAVL